MAPDHPIRRPFSDRCLALVKKRAIGVTDPLVVYEQRGLFERHRVGRREILSRGSLEGDARLESKTETEGAITCGRRLEMPKSGGRVYGLG